MFAQNPLNFTNVNSLLSSQNRVFDAQGVPGTSSTSTRSLANILHENAGYASAASAITTPVSNLDFAHVAAE